MSDLFCPQCDYNLTGLLVNRCPECGATFQIEDLIRLAAAAPKRIGVPAIFFHLIWPPLVFAALTYATVIISMEWLWGTFAITLVIFAYVQSFEMVRRFAATRSVRHGGSPYHRPKNVRLVVAVFVLVLVQFSLAFAGCNAALFLAH